MDLNKLLDHHHRQVNRKAWANLRQFMRALADSRTIEDGEPVLSPNLQITALCHRSLVNNGPALLFENPEGFRMPVLGNLFGNEQRVLAALELEKRQDLRELGSELAFLETRICRKTGNRHWMSYRDLHRWPMSPRKRWMTPPGRKTSCEGYGC